LLNAAALVGGHALAPTSDEPQFIGEGEFVLDESGQMYFKRSLATTAMRPWSTARDAARLISADRRRPRADIPCPRLDR
jgi:hypothetical protein